ncbi:MAG: PfkB family carbohydrate kinase [Gammaproteobacteria bacterium]|nr:PfkB family carbohydrate kinase [Gammaproteobacteria bacterium]
MSSVLCVGIATLDIVNEVDAYPAEDAEVRALAQHIRRGGNAANNAVVLAQQGHRVAWLGNLADDLNADLIKADLARYQVNYPQAPVIARSATPTSYIAQSRRTGSRTIVHYRNLPELMLAHASAAWQDYDWVHFEGRNESVTLMQLQQIHALDCSHRPKVSIEIEKVRERECELIAFADVVFFSRDYVRKQGCSSASEFTAGLSIQADQLVVIPWGEEGAYAYTSKDTFFAPAVANVQVVDSIGAGDCFIAAFIHAQLQNTDLLNSLQMANQLTARKLAQQGFDNLTI